MLDLYFAPTPNGWKITIMLEECALPYRLHLVNLRAGEQFSEAFLDLSPNNRIPALRDEEAPGAPLSLFESGAILLYLARKSGRFLPLEERAYYQLLQWLFWQVGGLGPMAGQLGHFLNYAPAGNDYSVTRYRNEYDRLLGVMEQRLRESSFLAGEEYTIADMAAWPWLLPYKRYQQDLDKFPQLRRWFDTIKQRPAVRRAVDIGKEDYLAAGPMDDEARRILFAQDSSFLPAGRESPRRNKPRQP